MRDRIELDLAQLRADYEAGMSLSLLARKHFVSHITAYKRLIEMGVEMRPPGRPPRETGENRSGYFQFQIAGAKEVNS